MYICICLVGGNTSTADEDISDYELDLIYDRQKIFPTFDCALMKVILSFYCRFFIFIEIVIFHYNSCYY